MTTPGFNNDIPQPNDTIADGQPDFLTNFSQLFNAFNNDHVSLSDLTNPGNHNVARLFQQLSAQTTDVSEVSLYSKGRKYQTNQLFFREQGNQLEYQYSNFQIFPLDPITQGKNIVQIPFFSFLPGNLLVYFGFLNPFGASPFSIILNPDICNNILGINFCSAAPGGTPPQIGLTTNTDGLVNKIILTASKPTIAFTSQYYIIFGNPVS